MLDAAITTVGWMVAAFSVLLAITFGFDVLNGLALRMRAGLNYFIRRRYAKAEAENDL